MKKRTLFILLVCLSVILIGCSQGEEDLKQMTDSGGLVYLEQITYRFLEADMVSSVKRCVSVREEIKTEYKTDDGVAKELLKLSELIEIASQETIEGNPDQKKAEKIGNEIVRISEEYLGGELPYTLNTKIYED